VTEVFRVEAENQDDAVIKAVKLSQGHSRPMQKRLNGAEAGKVHKGWTPKESSEHSPAEHYREIIRVIRSILRTKLLALAFFILLSAAGAQAQVFYSSEEFYRYLENRQAMAVLELQVAAWAREQEEAARQGARERAHQALIEEMEDELDRQAREALEWLKRN
jgi:hypothetical protein